jgi:hypothetical protein
LHGDTSHSNPPTGCGYIAGYFAMCGFSTKATPHLVGSAYPPGKDRRCICSDGVDCPAAIAVAEYLKSGRTVPTTARYYPEAPATCPICRAEIFDIRLSSKQRGAPLARRNGGRKHYWQAQVRVLRQKLAANPWLFPPVVLREGKRKLAYDGIESSDKVLYPGVLRSELL